ncbi:hypothetical protein ACFL2V_19250 [Pseudomonadota bacterium]
MKRTVQTSQRFRYVSSFLALLLWGGWAYFINYDDSAYSGIRSGLAQGIASFVMTLSMVHVITHLYNKLSHPVSQLLFPAILVVSLTCSCLIAIHTIVGTPNIGVTILPTLIVAFLFCVYTSFKLQAMSS